MKTPFGQECKYYYADYYRGKNTQECRMIAANPDSAPWNPALCKTCPAPKFLRANACPNLVFRGRVAKSFFGLLRQVKVEAGCREYRVQVDQLQVGCGKCHLHKP
ncbi:MAG: hypothetical protein HY868_02130 [Chloroflexi bacterium]|nr:hypothetical protein [Chloroflexota bacterium]